MKNYENYIFVASLSFILVFLSFLYGVAVQRQQIWPYDFVETSIGIVKQIYRTGTIKPENLLVRAPGEAADRVSIHKPDHVSPGYRVFMGWDQDSHAYEAWLFDKNGNELHTWLIDYDVLDPDGPLNDSDAPHGLRVQPDGSIIVNFDGGDIMARLDACSELIWTKKGVYHHEIGEADDGSMWTWRGEGTAYAQEQYLVNFDPQSGETIREINFVEEIIKLDERQAALFSVTINFSPKKFDHDPKRKTRDDIFHPNDIDVLGSKYASNFPEFRVGDLLISIRNLHMIAVIDPTTKRVKWAAYGPWRFQHDPDFTKDGKISIYNNNRRRDRSAIISIDPNTRITLNEFKSGQFNFYMDQMGTHQRLPNDNMIIVLPHEGRVVEIDPKGQLIFEFNNTYSKKYNSIVINAQVVPETYFETLPNCSAQK